MNITEALEYAKYIMTLDNPYDVAIAVLEAEKRAIRELQETV